MKTGKQSNLQQGELLLQEIFRDNPWKFLVCCIFQNLTTGKQVRPMMYQFFEKYPTPQAAFECNPDEMEAMLRPLGMQKRRTATIMKFSFEYENTNWNQPNELTGIGKYAQDSYDIFINNDLTVKATDKELVAYLRKQGIQI